MREYFAVLCALSLLGGCSNHNVPDIKAHADSTWARIGMKVVGYEGYQYGLIQTPGGCVWYTVRKEPDNGILYTGCISKWGDEYHIYSFRAYDAIKPGN